MGSVGDSLRRERLKYDLDLDRISQETRIPTRFLRAIEQEEFDKLPGRIFLFNFVRQYAQMLGLDEARLATQLRAELEPPPPPPVLEAPPPRPNPARGRVQLAGAAVVLVALVLVYAVPRRRSAPRVPATPTGVSAVSPASADRLVASGGETRPPEPPAASAGLRLVLVAKERAWVSATEDGRTVFSGMLQPNESRVLEGSVMDLVIGNPRGVEVTLDGKPVDIIGPRGELADVRITAPGAPPVVSHRRPLADLD